MPWKAVLIAGEQNKAYQALFSPIQHFDRMKKLKQTRNTDW